MSSFNEKLYEIGGVEVGIFNIDDYFGQHKYGYQVYAITPGGKQTDGGQIYRDRDKALMEADYVKEGWKRCPFKPSLWTKVKLWLKRRKK